MMEQQFNNIHTCTHMHTRTHTNALTCTPIQDTQDLKGYQDNKERGDPLVHVDHKVYALATSDERRI